MRSKGSQWVVVVAALAVGTAWAAPPAQKDTSSQPQNLQDALAQMDRSATAFQSVQADIAVDLYTAVVQDHEFQKGTTAFRRTRGAMEMATTINKGQEGETDLLYRNGQLDYYLPQRRQETILSAGANRQEWDSLLATGFGATGKELASAWTVKFDGMDKSVPATGGAPTAKLELVSTDAKVRSNFSQVTIWVDLSRDISMKQIFLQPDQDSRTVTYSNIRYNKPVNDKLFQLKVASGTQIQRR
ncbi:MAG TPA: outer membrane lipoprotein-sorting protein [Acidobacteriaceae bacterium]|jgi:outer membrane lipoprotein-sorting protein|nr:outer membrane lipoprotein-sorting protein [Acidobacteriaceae bacterium]